MGVSGIDDLLVAVAGAAVPLLAAIIGKSELGDGWVARANSRKDLAKKFSESRMSPVDAVAYALFKRSAALTVIQANGFDIIDGQVVELTESGAKVFVLRFMVTLPVAAAELVLFGRSWPGDVIPQSLIVALVATVVSSVLYGLLKKHPACKWNSVYMRSFRRREAVAELSGFYSELVEEARSSSEREDGHAKDDTRNMGNCKVRVGVDDKGQ